MAVNSDTEMDFEIHASVTTVAVAERERVLGDT